MKQISESKCLYELQKLIYLADINFLVCKKIYDFLPKDRMRVNKFLLLSANNAFNEVVGIIHTLLCSTKDEELTIKPLLEEIIKKEKNVIFSITSAKVNQFFQKILEDYPSPDYYSYTFLFKNDERLIGDIIAEIKKKKRQSGLEDLDILKKEFENGDFHKIRHQSVAHKNKLLKNPSGAVDLYLKGAVINELGKIIKKLRILSYFWFDYELKSPYFPTVNDLEIMLKLQKIKI